MSRQMLLAMLLLGALGFSAFGRAAAEDAPALTPTPDFFEHSLRPMLAKYCLDCHQGEEAEAELKLETYRTADAVTADRKAWENIRDMLRRGRMPPEGEARPPQEQIDAAVAWLETALKRVDCNGPIDPGRVTIRRLNRVEYANTIRDLLGVAFDLALLPADDVGYGFDNIGDVLSLPPILMEKYLAAAEQIADQAIVVDAKDRKDADLPESHRRIFFVRPSKQLPPREAGRRIVKRLAERAYRRPVTDAEVERLVRLGESAAAQGASFEECVQLVLQAILVSPHFLFKVELDAQQPGQIRELSQYELASRLSYFLWSSMPDDALFARAADGSLRKNLDAEVRRMLADRKSRALVDNFAGQWLELRNLDSVTPDQKQFPGFDDKLRAAMRTETLMQFAYVMDEDRSVLELIDCDYSFLNERLARHYGIPGVQGDQFRRVSLQGTPRGGVITQASVLTVTSNPGRTSPVKRGKWILENILGQPPPPPPPNVPQLSEERKAVLSGSLRERMEEHRRNPSCAVCHQEMDAMGFAMENFDAVGAWRTRDGTFPIDPSGKLPDGRSFQGPSELKQILLSTGRRDFARCMAEKMLTYALGRGLEYYDQCAVDQIVKRLEAGEYRFSALVLAVVDSEPFQKRRTPKE